MIPLQLKIKNFLSYGSSTQTINFEPYHLICFSGKNGHGKSALLDAITWVLWGQARKIHGMNKADEGLLRLGQNHMMVTLDFICNKKKYRVSREFLKNNNKTHTELSFGSMNNAGFFHGLNEKTIRDTQLKIINTLGLDYESCINSIFLRQGQSHIFSQKSPQDRKETLVNILGLNRYEIIRKKALDTIKDSSNSINQINQFITQISNDTAQKEHILNEYHITQEHLEQLKKEESSLKELFELHQQQKTKLIEQKNNAAIIILKKNQLEERIAAQKTELVSMVTEWRTVRKQLARQSFLYSLTEQKRIAHQNLLLENELFKQVTLQKLLLEKQLIVHQIHDTLIQNYTNKHQELLNTYNKKKLAWEHHNNQKLELNTALLAQQSLLANMHDEFKKLQQILLNHQHDEKIIITQEKRVEKRKQLYHQFTKRGKQLHTKLSQTHHHDFLTESLPNCPLCEEVLTNEKKLILQRKINQKNSLYRHQLTRLQKIIPLIKESLIIEHANLEKQKNCYLEHQKFINQNSTLAENIIQKTTLIETLMCTQQEQTILEEIAHKELLAAQEIFTHHTENKQAFITNNELYQEHILHYQALENDLKNCHYDEQHHTMIKEQLLAMQQSNCDTSQHMEQSSLQKNRKQEISNLCKKIRITQQELNNILQDYQKYQTVDCKYNTTSLQIKKIEEDQAYCIAQQKTLLQTLGSLQQQCIFIEKQEKKIAEYTITQNKLTQEINDYQEIAQALGKNGIQALLIENAIPEIEYEANKLLSKLTDNQSHIIIESLRDLKSGGTQETLDIKISDTLGIRPYEMFSGGEAFRIDFALRIALSKLLARKSGTSLQTLIIDEGFGSQDDDGLAHIMEALYKIQDDFAKIIIVSHLPTMKSQFPTHFFIQKNAYGSQVQVFEQG